MARTPFTGEHARRLRFVREAGFVGDGDRVFYTVTEIDDELCERNSLWLFDLDRSDARRLAEELGDVTGVAPSPNGSLLAVLAEEEGGRQVFLVPADGGEPRQLTALSQGVAGRPAWSPDGRSLALTAGPAEMRDSSRPYRLGRVTYRYDGLGYLDDAATDVYLVDVESGSVRQLTDDRCMNSDPRFSTDGRTLAYLVSFPPDREWSWLPELHVFDLESGESRPVVAGWGGAFGFEWSADGRTLVFVGARACELLFATSKVDVWTIDATGGEPECRTTTVLAGAGLPLLQNDLPIARELSGPRLQVDDDVVYVRGQVAGDMVVYRVALEGHESVEPVVRRDGESAYFVDFRPGRGVLHLATSSLETPELVLGDTRITELNDELLANVERPQLRKLAPTAADGLRTEAWALCPRGEGPWPTILYVHGGPYGSFGSAYMVDFQLLAGAGFAVVFHNFRGSGGYGSDFSSMIVGEWGRLGALDHHAAVDEAVRIGIADPDRLGVCGLSHGGFATCWLLGTSERFKAGVAENAVTNFVSSYATTDVRSWLLPELGGTPDEIPDVYRERSPLTHASNCKTPLLFIVGEVDWRCHPSESEQFYRVLRSKGVTTEMLRLPNSSHGGSADGPVAARIAQNEALVDWFRRYLARDAAAVQATAGIMSEVGRT